MLIETSLPGAPADAGDPAQLTALASASDPAAPYPVLLKPVTLEELGKAIDLVPHSAPVCPGV